MSENGELPLVRRSGKSEAAFRTISEVAEELDVPQHVLRFWESKFPQVKPLKRGGGRRYYRPEDVTLLRHIRDLLYSEGYTIKGVQKLLREGGHKDLLAGKPDISPEVSGDSDGIAAVDSDEPDFHDGEDDESIADMDSAIIDEDVARAVVAPVVTPMTTDVRHELQALLTELEQLRGLLQPR